MSRAVGYAILLGGMLLQGTLAAQQVQQLEGSPPSPGDSLLNTDREFNVLAGEKGFVEAFLQYMDDGAIIFPAGSEPITGREKIRKHLAEGSEGATLTWKPAKAEVAASSDLGYTYGTSEYRFTDKDGKTSFHYGKYVTVWKRQSDGRWKFIIDIGNSSPPRDGK